MPRAVIYATKRRKTGNVVGKPLKASKARSCEACRRLKTRCELHLGSDRCHRCDILRIECSLIGAVHNRNSTVDAKKDLRSVQCDCHARISALETSITKLRAATDTRCPDLPPSPPTSLIAERTARDAPMSLIQELRDNITIQKQPSDIYDTSEDVIINGIVSEDLARLLFKGFVKISSRWLFMGTDSEVLRSRSPLLFGACVLAGLHVNSTLHGSQTHHALYRHVQGLLGQSHLVSQCSLDTVQAMLISSMWDLRPMRDYDHGNSWLLSGTAAMQLMLTTPFDDLLSTAGNLEKPRAREIMRTWNLICLCQLQFSVGSGRPPVIAEQYLEECAKVLDFPSHNARDGLVLAGIQLYRALWSLTSSNVIQTEDPTWPEIDNLRKAQEGIYNLDSSEPLRFAYSCAYLILARRTLQHLSESPCDEDNTRLFIVFAIYQSRKTLEYFLSLSELTNYVHPSYENLLCSFAMVTLAEFVAYVSDINEVVVLMERAISHIQRGGKAEPVSRWALNVVRQHISADFDQTQVTSGEIENIEQYLLPVEETTSRPWEDGYWEQEFPSLEEMFFGNVI